MITLYYNMTNTSSKQAINWFKSREISILKKSVCAISRKDLLHILFLSEKGFSDILKSKFHAGSSLKNKIDTIQSLNFNEGINYILKNPSILKNPIIFEENKLLIGYNSKQIRQFIPQRCRSFKKGHVIQ